MTHTTKIASTGTQCACLPSRRPTSAVNRNPAIGRYTSHGIRLFEIVHFDIESYSSTSGVFLFR